MKNLLFGLIATTIFGFLGNAQTVKDYLVKSKTSITQTSSDGLYKKFVGTTIVPNGIQIINNNSYLLYTLNDSNYQMIEIPVISATKIVNIMFLVIDLKQNTSTTIFKNHQIGKYEFFDLNLQKLYSLSFTDININFNNEPDSAGKTCYQGCRAAAYAAIEGDWLSDLACSINPCGAAIAVYCGVKCR
ncbi:MAG: hypothetical protein H7174_10470 [Flavobacterium sp.]|nr:hypothetical protein [Flavobacterium sp.]